MAAKRESDDELAQDLQRSVTMTCHVLEEWGEAQLASLIRAKFAQHEKGYEWRVDGLT